MYCETHGVWFSLNMPSRHYSALDNKLQEGEMFLFTTRFLWFSVCSTHTTVVIVILKSEVTGSSPQCSLYYVDLWPGPHLIFILDLRNVILMGGVARHRGSIVPKPSFPHYKYISYPRLCHMCLQDGCFSKLPAKVALKCRERVRLHVLKWNAQMRAALFEGLNE